MKKMNRKGFTLIEMLVVIAIIAILVSIIVPVVGNSTTKAAAATNAANLRSVAAAVAIKHLENPVAVTAKSYTAVGGKLTLVQGTNGPNATPGVILDAPVAKAVTVGSTKIVEKGTQMTVTISADGVTATYGTGNTAVGIEKFADIAEDGK